MNELQNRLALVTGGGSGINLAFVKLLVQAGVKVVVADLGFHPQGLEWRRSLPSPDVVFFQKTDVTRWQQIEQAFDACVEKFGGVPDIVVPGAGVFEPSSNSFWKDSDPEDTSHYKVLDINLVHPIKTSRIAIRRMVQARKGGTIIHVSSIAGQRSSIITPLYTASKHGINSFVRGMAPLEELAGIRMVAVAPGVVETPLYTEHPEAMKFLDMSKDFLLPPTEVAQAMFALLTETRYPSGTVLEVCDTKGRWREVSLLNDPGPRGPASQTSKKSEAIKDILPFLSIDDMTGQEQELRKRLATGSVSSD